MSVQSMTAKEWQKQHLKECEEQERQAGPYLDFEGRRARMVPGFEEHWYSRVGDDEAEGVVRCKACGEIFRCKEKVS